MMNCRTIRKKLSAYQDKELSSDEQGRIRSHLQGCPECSEHFAEFQYTQEVLDELPDILPAPGFYLAVCKKISGLNDRRLIARLRQAFQFLPSPLAMAAYLVIGLLAGAYLANSLTQGPFISPRSTAAVSTPRQPLLASLRSFDAIAPGTLANGYVRMVRILPEGEDAQ
jgi:anti-sigma factor RsiW